MPIVRHSPFSEQCIYE